MPFQTHYGPLKTAWQRVLWRLWSARRENERINLRPDVPGGIWISGGWLPMYALRGPMLGGDSADRRLRNLRDDRLVPIEMRKHEYELYGKTRRIPIYRLACEPELLPWFDILNERGWVFDASVLVGQQGLF